LFYPAYGDESVYINQGKAIYQYRSDIQKDPIITTDGKNETLYNSAVRPGIPFYYASTLLFNSNINNNNYFLFKLFSFYYYLLLFVLFIFLSVSRKKTIENVFICSIIFIFFWGLTRAAMFNAKETTIFYFTLLSLAFLAKMISDKSKNKSLIIMHGIILGLNIFVNVHGIIIFAIILFISLFSYKGYWTNKIRQIIVCVFLAIIFSAFDIITMFKSVVLAGLLSNGVVSVIYSKLNHLYSQHFSTIVQNQWDIALPDQIIESTAHGVVIKDNTHNALYAMTSFADIYFKGKFQIFTNLGYYGLNGWFVLLACINFFKSIWKNNPERTILLFISIYYLLVIDPFNFNKSSSAIVLYGSTKYSSLVVLLGLVIAVNYWKIIMSWLLNLLDSHRYKTLFWFLLIVVLLLSLKSKIIQLLVHNLSSVIILYKDISFYQGKITLAFNILLLFIILLFFIFIIKKKYSQVIFNNLIILVIFIIPFFLFEPGKYPLVRTILDITKSNDYKLENVLISADVYKIYFNSKKIIPENSLINTNIYDLVPYNNYFKLSTVSLTKNTDYKIDSSCDPKYFEIILHDGNYMLCRMQKDLLK